MNLNRIKPSPKTVFLAGLACVAIGLLANPRLLTALFSGDGQLSPRSVVIIYGFETALLLVGLVLALSRSLTTLFNVLVGVGLTALLLIGLEKIVFYRLNHPPAPPPTAAESAPAPPAIHFEGSYTTANFFADDPLLGYKPRPNSQVESIKKEGDTLIYDTTYSIDEFGRRITPADDSPARDKFLLAFGDSFTFGEGVAATETLPAWLARLAPRYRAYNYGFSGYGPQQMLARLQSADLSAEVPEREGIGLYIFIDAHVERAIGSMYVYNAWGKEMPYYAVNWRGQVERLGSFRTGRPLLSSLYEWLGQTEFAHYYNLNIPSPLRAGDYWLTARIIAEARNEFLRRYPTSQFYVVVYPDEGDYFEAIGPYFEEFGLKVLNYDEWLKLDAAAGTAFKDDGHPTGKANRQVAEWIALDLGLKQ
ncbi:MAG: hypothetical protein FOGNACKC_04418 [Anaerolineae bacterium]|nr:hypothetical protein [Anaerolineae bacterium]